MLWDPAIAIMKLPSTICCATWSPCSRFIVISYDFREEVQILDAVTLKKLKSLISPKSPNSPRNSFFFLSFSSDSHTLMGAGGQSHLLMCWNLQTGVPAYNITEWPAGSICSTIYSGCGMMMGILFRDRNNFSRPFAIGTYSFHSSASIYHHPIEGWVVSCIWACGGCVQFATLDAQSIIIWEVGFTSTHPPTQVRCLPTPDNFDPWENHLFHPTPPRLAFSVKKTLFVWDLYLSKFLLEYADFKPRRKTFSSDGHLFVCVVGVGEIYLWEESLTSYILYQKLGFSDLGVDKLLLSPDGQSILVLSGSTMQLLHTKGPTISATSVPTIPIHHSRGSTLVFSQDGSLAVTTQMHSNTVTLLNLSSGLPWLIIDTGMPVCGMGVTRSAVAVVCDNKVITWNIPVGDCVHNTNVDINNSVQTTSLQCPGDEKLYSASISPDFNHLAITKSGVRLYDMSTGRLLGGSDEGDTPCFTSDGHEIWSVSTFGMTTRLAVVQDSGSNVTGLQHLDPSGVPSGVLPWQSPHGCKVTDDGWILNSSGKWLLWLPHHWQSNDRMSWAWGGQFLAILVRRLPEAVILELLEV